MIKIMLGEKPTLLGKAAPWRHLCQTASGPQPRAIPTPPCPGGDRYLLGRVAVPPRWGPRPEGGRGCHWLPRHPGSIALQGLALLGPTLQGKQFFFSLFPAETKTKARASESTDEKTGAGGRGGKEWAGKKVHTNPRILKQEGRIKKKPEAAEVDVEMGG